MQRRWKAPYRQAFAVPPRLAQDAGGRVQQRRGGRLLALTDTSSISPFTSMILKALATMTILTLAMTFTLANAMFSAVSNKAQQPGVEGVRCWVRIQAGYDLKTLLVGILDITNVVLLTAKEGKVAGCSFPTLRGWAAAPVRGLCSEDVHLPPAKCFLFISIMISLFFLLYSKDVRLLSANHFPSFL